MSSPTRAFIAFFFVISGCSIIPDEIEKREDLILYGLQKSVFSTYTFSAEGVYSKYKSKKTFPSLKNKINNTSEKQDILIGNLKITIVGKISDNLKKNIFDTSNFLYSHPELTGEFFESKFQIILLLIDEDTYFYTADVGDNKAVFFIPNSFFKKGLTSTLVTRFLIIIHEASHLDDFFSKNRFKRNELKAELISYCVIPLIFNNITLNLDKDIEARKSELSFINSVEERAVQQYILAQKKVIKKINSGDFETDNIDQVSQVQELCRKKVWDY